MDEYKKVLSGLNSFRSKVHKLDGDKLGPVPHDVRKLSDVVDNDVGNNKFV